MSHPQDEIGKSARNRIHSISGEQVQRLLSKLDAILPHLPPLPLKELISQSDFTPGEVSGGIGGGKHVLQECSILGHLRRIGAFDATEEEDATSWSWSSSRLATVRCLASWRASAAVRRSLRERRAVVLPRIVVGVEDFWWGLFCKSEDWS